MKLTKNGISRDKSQASIAKYDLGHASETQARDFFNDLASRPLSDQTISRVHIIESPGHKRLNSRLLLRRARFIFSRLGMHDSILEIGCGTGELFSQLPASFCGTYTGIDISEGMIRRFLRKLESSTRCGPIKINLRVGAASEADQLGLFDYVVTIGVFQYFQPYQIVEFFPRISSTCKEHTYFVFDFWNKSFFLKKPGTINSSDLSLDMVEKLLAENSFRLIDLCAYNSIAIPIGYRLGIAIENLLQDVGLFRTKAIVKKFGHRITLICQKETSPKE